MNGANRLFSIMGRMMTQINTTDDIIYGTVVDTNPLKINIGDVQISETFIVAEPFVIPSLRRGEDVRMLRTNKGQKYYILKIVDGSDPGLANAWIPNVAEDGVITWTLSDTTVPPEARNITGPQGRTGAKGDPGASAYEEAVANGFVGSFEDWLESLKGAKGDKGNDGDPGPAGENGKDGVGVPAGGETGEILTKASDTDYDTQWSGADAFMLKEDYDPAGDVSDYGTIPNWLAQAAPLVNHEHRGVVVDGDYITYADGVGTVMGMSVTQIVDGESLDSLNAANMVGVFFANSGNTVVDKPESVDGFVLINSPAADGHYIQILYANESVDYSALWTREFNAASDTWSDWRNRLSDINEQIKPHKITSLLVNPNLWGLPKPSGSTGYSYQIYFDAGGIQGLPTGWGTAAGAGSINYQTANGDAFIIITRDNGAALGNTIELAFKFWNESGYYWSNWRVIGRDIGSPQLPYDNLYVNNVGTAENPVKNVYADAIYLDGEPITPGGGGGGSGKRYATLVIGTQLSGHTSSDCDFLCDGTTDRTIIQQAMNSLPSGMGGKILFLVGDYNFDSNFTFSRPQLMIEGVSRQGVRFNYVGATNITTGTWIFNRAAPYATIKNISFDTNGINTYALLFQSSYVTVQNCLFANCRTAIRQSGAGGPNFYTDNYVQNCSQAGISVSSYSLVSNNYVSNSAATGSGGIVVSSNCMVTGNVVVNCTAGAGLRLGSFNNVVTGNRFTNNTLDIQNTPADDSNKFYGNWFATSFGVPADLPGRHPATVTVGHAQAGYTVNDVDYLCTGATSGNTDSVILQQAINAASTVDNGYGGKVLILEGEYQCYSAITINSSNPWVTIEGVGAATRICKMLAVNNLFSINSVDAQVTIKHLDFHYLGDSAATGSIRAIVSSGVTNLRVVDCGFYDFYSDINTNRPSAIWVNAGGLLQLENLRIQNCYNGLYIQGCTDVRMDGVSITQGDVGIYFVGINENIVVNNLDISQCESYGIQDATTAEIRKSNWNNIRIDGNGLTEYGLHLYSGRGLNITNLVSVNCVTQDVVFDGQCRGVASNVCSTWPVDNRTTGSCAFVVVNNYTV